ncbi:hypothetical protein [Alteribacter keqinensis]|uniref:Uncharacterized protein n=1 Tax=Alteribacter keqinensis TaxID=2483800 RepID=A0A3M7TPQ4_9BACI|nr:hypothetical protein [Alteribacter keqinensis]RNA67614.1 hypothetical protein EBO34_12890 [Alteribacter keqinensis]
MKRLVLLGLAGIIILSGCVSTETNDAVDENEETEAGQEDDVIVEEPEDEEDTPVNEPEPAEEEGDGENEPPETDSNPEEDIVSDEEQETLHVPEGAEPYLYENDEFGFSLEFPAAWRGLISIQQSDDAPDAVRSFIINYTPDNQFSHFFFSIDVLPGEYGEEYLEDTPWVYIASSEEYIFSYNIASEPSDDLLEPENEDKLIQLQTMINEELPHVIETFEVK